MVATSAPARDERQDHYETTRPDVQALVPSGARRILDLGCASGALGAALKERQGAEVVGVELDPGYARDAGGRLDRVVCAGAGEALAKRDELGTFDCVIAADVLEHLVDPWEALRRAAELLGQGGAVVVSVPNVRSWQLLLDVVVRGRWPRRPFGLFDATHLRWFTRADARELLESAGLRVAEVRPTLLFEGWQLPVARFLARTPLAPLVHGQYVLLGVKP